MLGRLRRHYSWLTLCACAVAASVAAAFSARELPILDGDFFDLAVAARTLVRAPATDEPVAVVAIDPATLQAPEFQDLPRVFFGPHLATLLNSLFTAETRAVGIDIAFGYSPDRFPGVGRNYDLAFRRAIARNRAKLALARTHQLRPAPEIVASAFDPDEDTDNHDPKVIAFAELFPDADGIVRRFRARLNFVDSDYTPPTFAGALLDRVQVRMPTKLMLAPDRKLETIPAYSLSEVLRCARSSPALLRRVFGGKVVLVGGNLPDEDRSRAPDRFLPTSGPIAPIVADEGCRLAPLAASDAGSGTAPGVFLHAAAVRAVLRRDFVRPAAEELRYLIVPALAIIGALLGLYLAPAIGGGLVLAMELAIFAASVIGLARGWWYPIALPESVMMLSWIIGCVARFLVTERKRQFIQSAFGRYLDPSLVARLAETHEEARLGGEVREISVMFADLSGFTKLSGRLAPEELMAVTNNYLQLLAAEVDKSGGYVDKFIGDAVMGLWGAPVPDPETHAENAVACALAILDKVEAAAAIDREAGRPCFSVKIGINSGPAVVGNVGTTTRHNYTAVGETVNIAARLESLPADYGCGLVIGPRTAELVAGRYALAEVDRRLIRGKDEPIAIYRVLGRVETEAPAPVASPASGRPNPGAAPRGRLRPAFAASSLPGAAWLSGRSKPRPAV